MPIIERGPNILRGNEARELPAGLERVPGGKIRVVPGYCEGSKPGQLFDTVINFETSRDSLRGRVPEEQRLTTDTDSITVLGFREDPTIMQTMNTITDIANDPRKRPDNPAARAEYRGHLESVYHVMAKEAVKWANGKKVLIFPPLNGGKFVREVFAKTAFPEGSAFYDYQMSRIRMKDGRLMVGITHGENNPEITDFERFVFADDCLASDISSYGTQAVIEEAFAAKGLSLAKTKLLITVSAASQRGLESILSPKTRKRFDFRNVKAIVGRLAYALNDHFYLLAEDDNQDYQGEERFLVGDMGDYTQPVTQ